MAGPRTTTKVRKRLSASGEVLATFVERTTTDTSSISPEARRNRAAAGAKNLQAWRDQQKANPTDRSIENSIAAFRAAFARDLGSTPTVNELVLLEGAVATFTALRLCIGKLKRTRNSFDETLRLTHEIATLQKQLLKTTATLTEMRTASVAPPTIADLILESRRLRSGDDDKQEPPEDDADAEPESQEPEPAA